jgi:hypothetical protein
MRAVTGMNSPSHVRQGRAARNGIWFAILSPDPEEGREASEKRQEATFLGGTT